MFINTRKRSRPPQSVFAKIEALENRTLLSGITPDTNLGTLTATAATDTGVVTFSDQHDDQGNFVTLQVQNHVTEFTVSKLSTVTIDAKQTEQSEASSGFQNTLTGTAVLTIVPDNNPADGFLQIDEENDVLLSTGTLSPSDTDTVKSVQLQPGTYFVFGTLPFQANHGNGQGSQADATYTMSLTTTPAVAPVLSAPTSISLGNVTYGTTGTATVTLKNTGGGTIDLGVPALSGDSRYSLNLSGLKSALNGGESTSFIVSLSAHKSTGAVATTINMSYSINGVTHQLSIPVSATITGVGGSAPTASIFSARRIYSARKYYYFTVQYTSTTPIDLTSLGTGDLSVYRRHFGTLSCGLAATTVQNGGTTVLAQYAVRGPARAGWTAACDGTFSILLNANQVKDTAGHFAAAAAIGIISVRIPA